MKRGYQRVGMGLAPVELRRARAAAKVRQMTTTEFLRQAVIVVSDETLATTRHESDPWDRRDVASFPAPR